MAETAKTKKVRQGTIDKQNLEAIYKIVSTQKDKGYDAILPLIDLVPKKLLDEQVGTKKSLLVKAMDLKAFRIIDLLLAKGITPNWSAMNEAITFPENKKDKDPAHSNLALYKKFIAHGGKPAPNQISFIAGRPFKTKEDKDKLYEFIKILTDSGIDIKQEPNGNTPMLFIAIINENFELADFLLAQGDNINRLYQGKNYLYTMRQLSLKSTRYLIRKGLDLNFKFNNIPLIIHLINSYYENPDFKNILVNTGQENFAIEGKAVGIIRTNLQ
jgi:hypothetical protein